MEESGYAVKRGRGGAISFLVPGQQRATRLRSSTLGKGFDPGDIRDVIAGKRPLPKLDAPAPAAPRRVDLIVDIQERLRSGKGPAYERWAKVYTFLETVRRYTDANTITKRMVAELIQYIEVYPAVKEDSITNQRVTIHYNCIGAFEVPDRRKIPERDILLETRKGVALSYAPTQIAI